MVFIVVAADKEAKDNDDAMVDDSWLALLHNLVVD